MQTLKEVKSWSQCFWSAVFYLKTGLFNENTLQTYQNPCKLFLPPTTKKKNYRKTKVLLNIKKIQKYWDLNKYDLFEKKIMAAPWIDFFLLMCNYKQPIGLSKTKLKGYTARLSGMWKAFYIWRLWLTEDRDNLKIVIIQKVTKY